MFRLNTLSQTTRLALLQKGTMKVILKEVKNSNGSGGSIVNSTRIFVSTSHKAMRIRGNIKKKVVTILIDSGSTRNFLDLIATKRKGCSIQTTNPMKLVVVDGTRISSDAICRQLTWNMQGKEFQAKLRLTPLGGCDVALGI